MVGSYQQLHVSAFIEAIVSCITKVDKLFGTESFVFQFAIQKVKDQGI